MTKRTYGLLLGFILICRELHADAGLPMLVLMWPGFIVALVPVIYIEIRVLSKRLGMTPKELRYPVTMANVVSTVFGIPLAWLAMLAVELITTKGRSYGIETFGQKFVASVLQAAWLIPYENEFFWLVPVALTVNFAMAFLVSWFLEAWLLSTLVRSTFETLKDPVRIAQQWSYSLLVGLMLGVALVAKLIQ